VLTALPAAVDDRTRLAGVLERFDTRPDAHVPEAIPAQALWWAFAHGDASSLVPGADGLLWRLGEHGRGDVTGRDDLGRVQVQVEVKSAKARWNYGSRCSIDCGAQVHQLLRMHAAAPSSTLVVVTHARRVPRILPQLQEAFERDAHECATWDAAAADDVLARLIPLSFSDVATALHQSVETSPASAAPDLLEFLFDVEPR